MKLSIIIVNHNNPYLIEKCLASITASGPTFPYEIIVVDNASSELPNIQISKYPNIQMIRNKENVGFGRANNQAVKTSNGEYLLFLNTDTEVLDDSITKLITFAENQPYDVIVGPKLLNPNKTEQPSSGPFYTLPVTFAMLFLKGDQLGITRYSPNKVQEVDWVSGACLLIKKDVFEEIGGFDESIFMYMDEIDLCLRAKKKGIHVLFYPNSEFIHVGAATSKSSSDPIINIYRGLLYFYKKHANFVQYTLVKLMLWKKAWLVIVIGLLTGNARLRSTYQKALSYL